MQISTFRVDKYKGCPVYYRNFLDHFEYLTIVKGELYTMHITVRSHWYNYVLNQFGFTKSAYTKKELEAIIKSLRRLAEATIDFTKNHKKVI